jgi:hypothetical protein
MLVACRLAGLSALILDYAFKVARALFATANGGLRRPARQEPGRPRRGVERAGGGEARCIETKKASIIAGPSLVFRPGGGTRSAATFRA